MSVTGEILDDEEAAARRLSIGVRTLARLVDDGAVKPVWVRGCKRFVVDDLVRYAESLRATAAAAPQGAAA
jgi:hypothetical protein